MWGIEKSSRLGIVRGFEGLVRQPRSVDMMRQVLTPPRHQQTLRLTFEKGTREECVSGGSLVVCQDSDYLIFTSKPISFCFQYLSSTP